jgi:hypothetical protein
VDQVIKACIIVTHGEVTMLSRKIPKEFNRVLNKKKWTYIENIYFVPPIKVIRDWFR